MGVSRPGQRRPGMNIRTKHDLLKDWWMNFVVDTLLRSRQFCKQEQYIEYRIKRHINTKRPEKRVCYCTWKESSWWQSQNHHDYHTVWLATDRCYRVISNATEKAPMWLIGLYCVLRPIMINSHDYLEPNNCVSKETRGSTKKTARKSGKTKEEINGQRRNGRRRWSNHFVWSLSLEIWLDWETLPGPYVPANIALGVLRYTQVLRLPHGAYVWCVWRVGAGANMHY